MHRLFALPAGRRAKWIVFVAWMAVVAGTIGFNLPGKFTDAERNESSSFLPGSAESTKALDVTKKLQDGELAPTVIVYRRDGGLTAADRTVIAGDIQQLNRVTRKYDNTTPFRGPRVSRDGTTALVANQIRGTGQGKDIIDPVTDYRDVVGQGSDGLQIRVSGPAGISADAIKVFENINGTLVGAAFLLVVVLLILIYRSPIFWFFPIFAVAVAEIATRGLGYALTQVGVTVNGQASSILSVLVIGAGTDYALLLVARYREELRNHQDKHEAMALALRRAGPAIFASGLTVSAALLSLSLAKVNGTAGLGPIGAMGIAVAILVMLTLLPALLVIVGRRRFWPFVPYGPEGPLAPDAPGVARVRVPVITALAERIGPGLTTVAIVGVLAALSAASKPAVAAVILAVTAGLMALFGTVGRRLARGPLERFEERMSVGRDAGDEVHGRWRRVGERVAAHPHRIAMGGIAVLVFMALGLLNFSTGLTQGNSFRDSVDSIEGQHLIAKAFPQGQAAPTDIVVSDPARIAAVARAAASVPGVAAVPPRAVASGPEGSLINAYLADDPYSTQAYDVIPKLRSAVHRADPEALVGGPTATEVDLRDAAASDTRLLVPVALGIVFVILAVLLRAIVAPLLLIGTVILSFLAALGVGAVVFDVLFGFPGSDPSLPLYAFIFLVALGVDYNIFLMARVREEAQRHGTREGMLRGLAVTGGVITSAGIVLAGTFTVLAVLPLVFLTEIGFVIAFGVLLDTFLVRSVLVPAMVFEIGPRVWWPSTMAASIDRRQRRRRRGGGGQPEAAGD